MSYKPFADDVLFLGRVAIRRGAVNGYVLTSDANGNATWQAAGSGGATWGSITGTLSAQTDLQAALDAKQNESIVINSNTTAVLDGIYTVVASATFTDPTPAEGKGFMVFVRNGTATVGGTAYSVAGTIINRVYHSGAWANYTSGSTALIIGTTPITSGTVGRILFEGAGNVLQQNSGYNFDTATGSQIIGGATARGTRLTLVNAVDTLASKTLVIRNAADSSETFSITGNGIVNIGVANSNSDVITLAGSSWFRATNAPATLQFQSLGFANVITNVNVYSNVIGHQNTLTGASSQQNNLVGFNNVIRGTVNDCNIFGQNFDVVAGSTRINAIGRRINGNVPRGIQGTDLTFVGYSLEVNTMNLSTNIITYFNNANISHAIRKGGNIALLGEKYQILQDSTGTVSQRLSTYMELAATNTVTIHNGTAPTGNITDAIQAYAADITAGNTAMHIRNENGDIIKLYAIGGWGTPTGTLTRTTFATYAGATAGALYDQTIMQNLIDAAKITSERLAALISDLKTGQQLLKA
jgi:hypothetical protein